MSTKRTRTVPRLTSISCYWKTGRNLTFFPFLYPTPAAAADDASLPVGRPATLRSISSLGFPAIQSRQLSFFRFRFPTPVLVSAFSKNSKPAVSTGIRFNCAAFRQRDIGERFANVPKESPNPFEVSLSTNSAVSDGTFCILGKSEVFLQAGGLRLFNR